MSVPPTGITPAFAGSTYWYQPASADESDHPRVCGEHSREVVSDGPLSGSPPRLRGAPHQRKSDGAQRRITPAFAGSTRPTRGGRSCNTDHPRVCGEHVLLTTRDVAERGSPPRLRGARQPEQPRDLDHWITPAFAGSTSPSETPPASTPDHPRVCGEHRSSRKSVAMRLGSPPRLRGARAGLTADELVVVGSPPRLRGALSVQQNPRLNEGITPAFAGSTASCNPSSPFCTDHPRVCGEHIPGDMRRVVNLGSPARLRGALSYPFGFGGSGRITPAFAGSTASARFQFPVIEDHPRVCGEHHDGQCVRYATEGSPPRLRGAPVFVLRRQ